MNRASLALGLLLGTVAAALVAIGVAHDLDRAELRTPSVPTAVATVKSPNMIERLYLPVEKPVVFGTSLNWPITTEPAVHLPLSTGTVNVDLNAWLKFRVAIPKLQAEDGQTSNRVIIDDVKLAQILSDLASSGTSAVDRLIRENDGINDVRDADAIPFGHVMIGGRLVGLEHRGINDGSRFAWTGRLHYGADPRQTLQPVDSLAASIAAKTAALPWAMPRLWSEDRRAMIAAASDALRGAGEGTLAVVNQVGLVIPVASWANHQFNAGLELVTLQVKRQAWLALIPTPTRAAPVQSAQRQGGKGIN